MKVLILASRFPYPIEKGDKLRLYHQIIGLAKEHEVHLVAISEKRVAKEDLDHIQSLCASVHVLKINTSVSRFIALKAFVNGLPFQVTYFFRNKWRKRIEEIADGIRPDMVYCQLIRMAEYAKGLSYPKVLDYMDAFSLSTKRRSDHDHFFAKVFYSLECEKLRDYEQTVSSFFDYSTVISEQDKKHLLRYNPLLEDRLMVVSNGLDAEYFTPTPTKKSFDIVFVGNMGYRPNILAAGYLIKKVKPLLDRKLTYQIAGARPTRSIRKLASDRVNVTGWMNDIRDAYNNSIIFVAPIFTGAGQQNKIMEAMSMGLPCITTAIVNESIDGIHGEHLFIAKDEVEFAGIIRDLMADELLRAKIGNAARLFVKQRFSWEKENLKLTELFKII